MALRSPESFEVHEFARFFPPLDRTDFELLKLSIEAHGLLQPVTVFEGKLIDGIHRLRALGELGRMVDDDCDVVELDTLDGKPLHEVIWSLNGHRRHMGPSLKAAVYVKLFGEVAKRKAAERQAKGQEKGREAQKSSGNPLVAPVPPTNSDDRTKARDEIAQPADVSRPAVKQGQPTWTLPPRTVTIHRNRAGRLMRSRSRPCPRSDHYLPCSMDS